MKTETQRNRDIDAGDRDTETQKTQRHRDTEDTETQRHRDTEIERHRDTE